MRFAESEFPFRQVLPAAAIIISACAIGQDRRAAKEKLEKCSVKDRTKLVQLTVALHAREISTRVSTRSTQVFKLW
jgi:hypothetical protein